MGFNLNCLKWKGQRKTFAIGIFARWTDEKNKRRIANSYNQFLKIPNGKEVDLYHAVWFEPHNKYTVKIGKFIK